MCYIPEIPQIHNRNGDSVISIRLEVEVNRLDVLENPSMTCSRNKVLVIRGTGTTGQGN